jgi:electron transport complex protein RnfC
MRGFATYTVHHPVEAAMDTVIVQNKTKITEVSDSACINCGKCIQICPAQIPVNMLVRNLEIAKYEEAADFYDLFSCIECGLCTYVCTAQIPIFQHIMLGKHKLLNFKADA